MRTKILRHWFLVFITIFSLFNGLPFAAPLFMKIGWDIPARIIYFIYSFLCHQLPQRSYFLFGGKFMYTLGEIQSQWQNTNDFGVLRKFIGNPEMGWKVAWSDRMIWMYGSILICGLIWYFVRHKIQALPLWGLILFITPMGIDGFTHLVSDLSGFGLGFRDSNLWLAVITNRTLPANFYVGDGLGSFNSMMRFVSGVLFGAGIGWFVFPQLDDLFHHIRENKQIGQD